MIVIYEYMRDRCFSSFALCIWMFNVFFGSIRLGAYCMDVCAYLRLLLRLSPCLWGCMRLWLGRIRRPIFQRNSLWTKHIVTLWIWSHRCPIGRKEGNRLIIVVSFFGKNMCFFVAILTSYALSVAFSEVSARLWISSVLSPSVAIKWLAKWTEPLRTFLIASDIWNQKKVND